MSKLISFGFTPSVTDSVSKLINIWGNAAMGFGLPYRLTPPPEFDFDIVVSDIPDPPPTNLFYDTVGGNLTWEDNSDNEDNFYIEYRSVGSVDVWNTYAIVGSNITSYPLTGPLSYEFRISAYNDEGSSFPSNPITVFI